MAIIRRAKNKETLLRRAHLGNIDSSHDILNIAIQNGIKTTPLDISALMQLLGIDVIYSDTLDSKVSGSLKIEGDRWVCTVNKAHHHTRQRFTLAHELAHYILHRNEHNEFIDHTYFRTTDSSNTMEFEANEFAGSLLMPEESFRHFVKNVSHNIDMISEYFGVSPIAVRVRAKQLGFKESN